MRTTLTLDADVAVQLERLRRAHNVSLKDLVNDALRRGLREMSTNPRKARAVPDADVLDGQPVRQSRQLAEAIAHADGDGFK
jgi:hypothetical protein